MQEIIAWLRNIELLASKLYLEASCSLEGDQKFASFLSRMSADESWHYHIIGSAAQYLAENNIRPEPAIEVDADLKRSVEMPLHALSGLLAAKKLTKWDKKILIVDDEPTIREILSETLKGLGAVQTAVDGRDALNILQRHFFNAILSDIHMPGMSGIEFYRQAVELSPNFRRNFLFISGDLPAGSDEFIKANHLLCLEKPFSLKRIRQLVQEIMDKTL